MSLYLAFKRVGRFYRPSPRRWVRENYLLINSFVLGILMGMSFCDVARGPRDLYVVIAAGMIMIALRWWAPYPGPTTQRSMRSETL
jgi:hypothetical protein